jgi:hypothetical protein
MVAPNSVQGERKLETGRDGRSAAARRKKRRICLHVLEVIFLSGLILVGTERQAYAYTDPGSGALIWQMIGAAILGAGFYFRKILFWFKGKKDSKEQKD